MDIMWIFMVYGVLMYCLGFGTYFGVRKGLLVYKEVLIETEDTKKSFATIVRPNTAAKDSNYTTTLKRVA